MKPKMLIGFIIDGKAGGVDKYILNFYHSVKSDAIEIDFLTNEIDADLERYFAENGSKLHCVSRLSNSKLQYQQVRALIREYHYDIVYINISTAIGFPALQAAHDCGVKKIIVHSHAAGFDCENALKRAAYTTLHKLYKYKICKYATDFLACSEKAAEWMFTKKVCSSGKVKYIFNGVDLSCIYPDEKKREAFRRALGVDGKFVIGNVGNLSYPKNQLFLLEVFAKLLKKEPNAALIIIGDGVRMESMKAKISKLGIEDAVQLLGRVDISKGHMNAFDVFAFPSLFEGLGIALVEAQCTHVPCVASTEVPKSARISNICRFAALDVDLWVDELLRFKNFDKSHIQFDSSSDFDLAKQKQKLRSIIEIPREDV